MANKEKVECLLNIDTCNSEISKLEKEIEKRGKLITQGALGLLIGVVSFIMGFYYSFCFLGCAFLLVGVIMIADNWYSKSNREKELLKYQEALQQWKKKLYELEE